MSLHSAHVDNVHVPLLEIVEVNAEVTHGLVSLVLLHACGVPTPEGLEIAHVGRVVVMSVPQREVASVGVVCGSHDILPLVIRAVYSTTVTGAIACVYQARVEAPI